MPNPREALKRACDSVGGQKPLASRIGTSQSMVWYWLVRAKKGVPAEYVIAIERATGVSRYELRPDVFLPPVSEAAPACEAGGGSVPSPAGEGAA